ncbi:dethiobiotin synthase [Haloglycomyces albus]|uniref:dethiobiotin synthase n=1 Tax=Haloglycomyces albus TaxID=526067 RepID=UPI000684A277|nr:dethiobiotin synthase [Haloglycomyces albus]
MFDFRGPVLVTGTDTGVGKTVVTAALASQLRLEGSTVEVIKIAQTGDDDDAAEISRLADVPARALVKYRDPLAPLTAARREERPPLSLGTVVDAVYDSDAEVILLEGAGGLLVELGENGWTLADLAVHLECPSVVVARSGLGTLNHTALTLEALRHRGIESTVVIGALSAEPDLAESENLTDLPGDRLAVLPAGMGALTPEEFQRHAEKAVPQLTRRTM